MCIRDRDRIRSGLERRVTDDVFRRALDNIEEYRGNLEKIDSELDLPESGQLRDVKQLEIQVKSLQAPMMKWLEEKKEENEATKGDDMRVPTQDFLDVFSRATEGVLENDEGDDISRILLMVRRLFSVTIDEEEDSDDEEQNDCTRIAEMLEICIRFRNSSALSLVFDELLDSPRITCHLLDPSVVGKSVFESCRGSILMSGTLFPPMMYSEILGIPANRTVCKVYSSDFPVENRPVLIASDVTSKFTERERSIPLIGQHVRAVIENTDGNVAIFAPSYTMLERIHSDFINLGWNGGCLLYTSDAADE